jgi:predicted DNA-binding WGR domain protein
MSHLTKSILKVASQNPDFRKQLIRHIMAESKVPGNKSKGPKELGEEDMGWEPGHVVSEKKAKLMKNQEKILQEYMKSGGKEMFYDDLPESVKAKLRRIKDQETLDSDVDRFLNDNRKFAAAVLIDESGDSADLDIEKEMLAKLKAAVTIAGGIALDLIGMNVNDRTYDVISDRLNKVNMILFRKMDSASRSKSLQWGRKLNQGLRLASEIKVAHRPILFREGLTASKVKSGEAFMVYKIDKGANNSKFYEGLILPMSDGQYVLKRRWGRLTDSGSTGRVDSRDDFFSSLDSAKSSLRDHYMKRLAHGYVDTFGPKHIDPATRAKLKQGEYPIGLGGAGFGWGGQQMVNQVGTLKTLRKYISESMKNFTEPRWRFQALADLDIVDRELGELGESTMAKKLRDYFKKARSIITKATDPAGVAQARKALIMIDKYVAKQMAHT